MRSAIWLACRLLGVDADVARRQAAAHCSNSLPASWTQLGGSNCPLERARHSLCTATLGSTAQIVLPHTQYAPSGRAEHAVYFAIAGSIPGELRLPECAVAFGPTSVQRAAVPKASVDEECKLFTREDEIGLTEKTNVAPPAGYSILAEQRYHYEFGCHISPSTNSRHDRRANFLRENVAHFPYQSPRASRFDFNASTMPQKPRKSQLPHLPA